MQEELDHAQFFTSPVAHTVFIGEINRAHHSIAKTAELSTLTAIGSTRFSQRSVCTQSPSQCDMVDLELHIPTEFSTSPLRHRSMPATCLSNASLHPQGSGETTIEVRLAVFEAITVQLLQNLFCLDRTSLWASIGDASSNLELHTTTQTQA